GTFFSRATVATALMSYSALMITLSGGRIEYHFHVFCALAFLLVYRDWRVPVVGASVIAFHHALFKLDGGAMSTFPHGDQMWGTVFLHAGFVVFETAVLVYLSLQLARETLDVRDRARLERDGRRRRRARARDRRRGRGLGAAVADAGGR